MHRYEELEKLYYKKKFKQLFLLFFLIIGLFVLSYFLFKHFIQTNQSKKIIKSEKNKTIKKIYKKKVIEIERKINVKTIQQSSNKERDNVPILSFKVPDLNLKSEKKEKIQKNKLDKNNSNTYPLIKESSINVKKLIYNFNINPSYETAMEISTYYLNKGKLDKSKLWALKANTINSDRYESWKMFALILLKKHKKQKAKEVLQTYLHDYGYNNEIDKLLRSIQ